MPRYLAKPNEYGYHASVTGYLPPHEAEGLTEYTGQPLPCWPDGTPLTEQELADIAEQQEQARIQSLLPSHGQSVATLVQCLAQFGISLPVDFSDAVDTMFVTLETSPEMSRWAMLAQTTYIGLQSAGLTDHDIYLISEELI